MPIIDQCEGSSGNLTALSSTLEIFDKFKSVSDNGKDSDSEESFHLPLDDDDAESTDHLLISNCKDKDSHKDEAGDILSEDLSSSCPESISSDAVVEESVKRITRKSVAEGACKKRKKTGTNDNDDSSTIKVKLTFDYADYETNTNGEFRSYYEADGSVVPDNRSENRNMSKKSGKMEVDRSLRKENKTDNRSTTNSVASSNSKTSNFEETSTDDLLKQLDESINSTIKNIGFKMPQKSEPVEPKKNLDQPDEDDADLLDISMIRETEEDDACAIAEAIEDDPEANDTEKDANAAEKFDDDTRDKVEQEQDSSDGDKDNERDSLSQYQLGYEDTDEDTRVDLAENNISGVGELDNLVSNDGEDSESRSSDVQSAKRGDIEARNIEQQKEGTVDARNNLQLDECDTEKCLSTDFSDVTNKTDLASESINESAKKIANPPSVIPLPDVPRETISDSTKTNFGKRSLSSSDIQGDINPKKAKLAQTAIEENNQDQADSAVAVSNEETKEQVPIANDNVKTLSSFAKFMQFRKLSSKLSRSDLEQFCIQKICECLMLRSTEGELHHTIKKQQKAIEGMRKDLQQLIKQSKDLEIVNKRLMNELKVQSVHNKPLVPLKITRSVGLQVRLNPSSESPVQVRRRQPLSTPQQKPAVVPNAPVNKTKPPHQPSVVRQILPAPPKSPHTSVTPSPTGQMLSQVLQQNNRKSTMPANRRNTPTTRKSSDASVPSTPGVIDLTDEDEKLAANRLLINGTIKLNKPGSSPGNSVTINKIPSGKSTSNQGKPMGLQQKTNKTNISPGIRLASGSVLSSGTNGSQMLYVVPTLSSNGGSTQKLAFVNFQQTNGVLTGSLSTSTVSMVSKGQTVTLKSVPIAARKKHPAPLPPLPRIVLDPSLKPVPPKPHLTIRKIEIGIILQWKMPYNLDLFEDIASYQLYAYQETSAPPNTDMWRKVGDVKALALPMACTLTQFADKNKYYFAVRSVDVHKRIGAFSDPEEISL